MSDKPSKFRIWTKANKKFGELIDDSKLFGEEKIRSEWTGLIAEDGQEVFDEDIVKAHLPNHDGSAFEVVVDRIHWEDGAWRFGAYDGTLSDYVLMSVEGNTFEKTWPINQ